MNPRVSTFIKDKIHPARLILLNSRSVEFLGIIAYGLKILVFENSPIKGSKKSERGFLGYTDGKRVTLGVYDKATPREVAFILCHELLHILMYHIERKRDKDPIIWNLATDHVINKSLKPYTEKGTLHWIDGIVYFDDVEKEIPGATAEQVYDYLINNKVGKVSYSLFSVESNGEIKEIPEGTDVSKVPGKKYAEVTYEYPDGSKKKFTVPLDESDDSSGKSIKEVQDRAKYIWSSDSNSISKGDMPGDIKYLLDKLLKVEVPWNMILERSILYHSQETVNRGWKQPDIYMRGNRLDGHGKMYTPGKVASEKPQIALFVVDSSGSISDEDLKKFTSIICDSTQHYKKLGVLVHDTAITMEKWFLDRPSEDIVFESIKEIIGRGGTSHTEVFEKIGDLNEEYQISVVVFMTDFESNIEMIYRDHEWFSIIPSIWLLNNKHANVDFDESYDTTVIQIED